MNLQIHNSGNLQQKMWRKNLKIVLDITNKKVSELISERVLRLRVLAEVDGSSILSGRAELESLSQRLSSNDFRCLKVLHSPATFLVGVKTIRLFGKDLYQMESGYEKV